MMIQCPKCKQMLDESMRFCPNDGTPLHETTAEETVHTPSTNPDSHSVDLELPVVLNERYRLEEKRGGGGMAKVYRARDLTLERDVAVKIINPELREEPEFDVRFDREAKIVSKLSDPQIVTVHDYGIDSEHGPYLVMEYLNGQSLRERLTSEGPFPYRVGLQIAGQILLGLIHAYTNEVIHRDLKPENILLTDQSGVKLHVRLVDFGIARLFRQAEGEALTHPGATPGTPRYMAPEQLSGGEVDARTDLYSAALVIHELITGKLPFAGAKLSEFCPKGSTLDQLLKECLSQDPNERPDTPFDVYFRLQELGQASGVILVPPGSLEKLLVARQEQSRATTLIQDNSQAHPGSKSRWLWPGLIVLAALTIGLLWIALMGF